jgi:predicted permease
MRQAIRALTRAPWYAATAISVMALSMALATTTFLIVDGVLFKPLPYDRPEGLYIAGGSWLNRPSERGSVSPKDFRDWSAAHPDLRIAAMDRTGLMGRLGDFPAKELIAVPVTANFFDTIGLRPMLGGFERADFAPGGDPPVIISYGLWQSHFGGRPDAIGARLELPGTRSPRVAGVLPPDFVFPDDDRLPDLIMPAVWRSDDFEDRSRRRLTLVVRIPANIPLAQAQDRFDRIAQQFMSDWPAGSRLVNGPFDHVHLAPIETVLTLRSRPTFAVVFLASAVLIALACLNLAGLAAARAEDRGRDIAIRRALGASAAAIARMQFTETFLLAACGALLALALTPSLASATLRLLPSSISLLKTPVIDARVLAFAAIAATAVALLVSLWPSVVAARTRAAGVVASLAGDTGRVRRWSRRVLVTAQVAVGLVLAIGGTLVVGSLVLLWSEDPGYSPSDALVIEVRPSGDDSAVRAAVVDLVARFEQRPGVRRAAAFDGPFLRDSTRADIGWRAPTGARRGCLAGPKSGVTAGFFDALGFEPLAGRFPSADEIERGELLAVISESAARACWPDGSSAVGRTFEMASRQFTVAGVVRNVRFENFDRASRGEVYVSHRVVPPFSPVFVLRTSGSADRAIAAAIGVLREAGLLSRTSRATTMSDAMAESIRPRRLNAWLFGLFAAAALAIVAVGILGVTAMTTARRTREIGVRYALGGRPRDVVRLLLREQAVDVAIGVLAGGALAVWAVQFTASYLYRFAPSDPRLWAIAIATIVVTALAGAAAPAIRASRVDPIAALRVE